MRHTIWKVYYDYRKEEEWINSLADRGLLLVDSFWCRYVFEDGTPGDYIYRVEFLDHRAKHPESIKYLKFLEETGVEHIASYMHWVTLRKKKADGDFELYTDLDSKIKRCGRIMRWFLALSVFEYSLMIYEIVLGIIYRIAGMTFLFAGIVGALGTALLLLALSFWKEKKRLQKEKNIYES